MQLLSQTSVLSTVEVNILTEASESTRYVSDVFHDATDVLEDNDIDDDLSSSDLELLSSAKQNMLFYTLEKINHLTSKESSIKDKIDELRGQQEKYSDENYENSDDEFELNYNSMNYDEDEYNYDDEYKTNNYDNDDYENNTYDMNEYGDDEINLRNSDLDEKIINLESDLNNIEDTLEELHRLYKRISNTSF